MEPENEEQMAHRRAVASGESQHDENSMRDIHIGKRGSETASEEQADKLRRTVRFEQELRIPRRLQPCMCLLSILRVVRDKFGRSPYLCKIQVMPMMKHKFLSWMCSTRWMDERVVTSRKCWLGIEKKIQEISRTVN